jgi:hypothetical protein
MKYMAKGVATSEISTPQKSGPPPKAVPRRRRIGKRGKKGVLIGPR